MKKFLAAVAMALAALSAGAQLSVLDRFAPTWDENSSYDAATKTITFGSSWSDVGVLFDAPADMSEYSSFEVTFEPIDFFVCLVIEYEGTKAQVTDITEGATSISAALNPEFKDKVNAVYLEAGELAELPSRMVLKTAEFVKPDYTNLIDAYVPLYGAQYDLDTHIATFTESWGNIGVELGLADLTSYTHLSLDIEPVDYPVFLTIKYDNGERAQVVTIPAGENHGEIWLDENFSNKVVSTTIEIDELPSGEPVTLAVKAVGFVSDSTGLQASTVAEGSTADVYNMAGVLVRKNAIAVDSLEGLAPGIYIVGTRKYIKK
ncbi:MAG: T9SS type A sorting domain-containing protein [Bacteroidales bacterium]|nr:T9SS type A sorting domain-containing protein [Bacteroidales bacterium]